MKQVVLGLSGGVDSAVAARLLQQQGYAVRGLYLDIGSAAARQDAEDTAAFLGIPLTVKDISAALEAQVCAPFAAAYLRGETPNPCILCNPTVKFAALLAEADTAGAAFIATGHYARTENGALLRGKSANDQSYMLCRITRAQLDRLLLPLGEFEKARTRAMAEDFGIPVARKPDSMEICFIPDKDYAGWLTKRGAVPPGGNFLRDETVLGPHGGIHRWTVGQRIPGVFDGQKLYVGAIDPVSGDISVCTDGELFRSEIRVKDVSWLIDAPDAPIPCSVKVRHTKTGEVRCTAFPTENGGLRILCDSPVRAPAPGQAAALYDGDQLLGGGTIV